MKRRRNSRDVEDKSIFDIDLTRLEEEWSNHARLSQEYSEHLADANRRLDELNAEAKVIQAEVADDVRRRPGRYGYERGKKPAESAVKDAVTRSEPAQEIERRIIRQKHRVAILQGYVYSLIDRKKALEKLVDLWIGQYWSKPKEPRQQKEGRNFSDEMKRVARRPAENFRKRRRRDD